MLSRLHYDYIILMSAALHSHCIILRVHYINITLWHCHILVLVSYMSLYWYFQVFPLQFACWCWRWTERPMAATSIQTPCLTWRFWTTTMTCEYLSSLHVIISSVFRNTINKNTFLVMTLGLSSSKCLKYMIKDFNHNVFCAFHASGWHISV